MPSTFVGFILCPVIPPIAERSSMEANTYDTVLILFLNIFLYISPVIKGINAKDNTYIQSAVDRGTVRNMPINIGMYKTATVKANDTKTALFIALFEKNPILNKV